METYKTVRGTHKFGEKILRYSIFRTINDVPDLIRKNVSIHSFKGFSDYCKTFFISNYTAACEIVHPYSFAIVRRPISFSHF